MNESAQHAVQTSESRMPSLPRRKLIGLERWTVPLLEKINGNKPLKTLIHGTLGRFDAWWIAAVTRNNWVLHNVEIAENLDAPRGVILVSNHRSFFDMYIFGSMLTERSKLMQRLFFPVRKDFFYDNPAGVLVNLLVSGGSMWPPVFRDQRRDLNPTGLQQLAHVLQRGSMVGIHPEGKRGTGPDPWELQAVKPGIGRLVQACAPETVVLPFFILGCSNDFVQTVTRGFRARGNRGEPVRMWVGEPFTVGELQQANDPTVITARIMQRIRSLAEKDKAWRAENPGDA